MTRNMLIDAAHPEEVRVCVLENGRVEDFDFEFSSRKPLRGNIYLARITRVEPSLQAAFVEYGGNRHGFLAFNEIHPDYYQIPVSDRRLLQEAEAEESALAAELGLDRGEDESDLEGEDQGGGEDDDAADFRDAERAASVKEEDADSHSDDGDEHDGQRETAPDHEADDDADDDVDVDDNASGDIPRERNAEMSDDPDRAHDDAGDDETVNAHNDDDGAPRTAAFIAAPAPTETETDYSQAPEDDAMTGGAADEAAEAQHPTPKSRPANARRGELLDRYREARRKRQRLMRNYKIQEVIKRRQIMLVQVVKEERGTKGAALTTYMSLAGRYCVLMPNTARGGGISRKIGVAVDRKRLRGVVDSLELPQGMGLIIRTAGAKRTKVEIKRDYDYLTRLWENIRTLTLQSIAPCLIYEEASLIKRAIRDLYDKDIEDITVEGEDGYREAKDFMKMLMPSHAKNVRQHKDAAPLFLAHDVESQLDAMYQPMVRLKSGGYLVIHQTEALVAIDVNSGKATRERNIEQTALKTNLEAAKEAARQCRLRDLAGLIVIDFIDMEEQRNNRSVEKRFKDALKDDRARIQVGRISNFGLLEMSRQRRRSGIIDGTTHVCPTCSGAGNVRSDEMAALRILRAIETSALKERSATIAVRAGLDVTLYILNHKRAWLKRIEDSYAVTVEIIADSAKAGDIFDLERRGPARDAPQALQVVRADQTEAIEIEARPEDDADIAQASDDGDQEESRGGENRGERSEGSRQDGADGGRRRRRKRRRGRREDGTGPRDDGGAQTEQDRSAHERNQAAPQNATSGGEDADDDDFETAEDSRADRSQTDETGDGANGDARRRRRRGRRGGRRNRSRAEIGNDTAHEHRGETGGDVDGENAGEPLGIGEPAAAQPSPSAADDTDRVTERGASRRAEVQASEFIPSPPMFETPPPAPRDMGEPTWREPPRPDPVASAPDAADHKAHPAPAAEQEPAQQTPREARPQRKGWWQRAIGG